MSKYLHFGRIPPIWLALEARKVDAKNENIDPSIEGLIMRRELSMNFVFYTPDYDSYACLPGWARKTLEVHKDDECEYVYTREQLENARTHDEYWNAAMKEMVYTGCMHDHMRMYWGKKILEWSDIPERAYRTTLHLNNKYFLDRRDPNSYTNIAPTSASTIGYGPSARSTARSATCPLAAGSARHDLSSTSRRGSRPLANSSSYRTPPPLPALPVQVAAVEVVYHYHGEVLHD